MRGTKLLLRVMATVAALTLVLAACGSSDDGSSTSATEAPTTAATESPTPTTAEGTAVAVTMGETDVQNMYMNLDPATVSAGSVTFTVVNEGVKKHEFVVLSTDVLAADLPIVNDEVNEEDYVVIDEIEDLPPGETGTLTVDLAPGHYALICNLKGHMRMGMYTDITVT